jgi:hypothetical protein
MVESGAEANNNKNGWPYLSPTFDAPAAMVQRAYLKFATPSLPAGAVISAAYIELWDVNTSPGDRLIELRSAAASWTETTITWNNQPGSTGAVVSSRLSYVTGAYNVFSGLADTVAAWIAGTLTNYGFRLALNSEGAPTWGALFYTRENANPPHLVIVYNTPPSTPTWATSPGVRDIAASLALDWDFVDPDAGDVQSLYALKRDIGGTVRWWNGTDWSATTETYVATAVTIVTLAAGWGADADATHLYSVRTKDEAGLPSAAYSATLAIIPSAKSNPTIDTPADAGTVATSHLPVTWTVAQQSEYRLEILNSAGTVVLWDSGWVVSTGLRAFDITAYTLVNGTSYKVRLTTKNTEGLASTPDTNSFSVVFVAPAAPTVLVIADSTDGFMYVDVTNPTPTGGQPAVTENRVWRRPAGDTGNGIRVAVGVANNGAFTDWLVGHLEELEYRIETIGANGTSAFSAWA